MTKTLLRFARLAPLALLFAGVAGAQTTSTITGTVTDGSTGKGVVGAVVVATTPAVAGEKTTVTDASGGYALSGLVPGKYKVSASFEGYKTETRADLALGENVTLRANLAIVPEAVQMEEVVVTGSRIKRKDLNTPAPVSVVNKEQMATSGKIALGDFLQSMPEQGNAVNAQVNNGNDGTVLVDLRSIGAQRTLVLLNGRRMVGDGGVDLGSIPAAAVERIEILKDGASAVYGSDAVAGVVNVILKKRFNGTDLSAYAGTSSRGDANVYDLAATTGTGSEKGNLLFSIGLQKSGSLMAKDRDFAGTTTSYNFQNGERSSGGNSSTFPAGRFTLPTTACSANALARPGLSASQLAAIQSACAAAQDYRDSIGSGSAAGVLVPQYDPATASTPAYQAYDFGLYNTNPTNYVITPARRVQLFSAGDANLGSVARAYYEASFVDRTSAYTLAPMPLVNNSIPTNPVIVSKDSIYNPFGVNITSWRHRTTEFGDRLWDVKADTFHAVLGVDGTLGEAFGPLHGWSWDVSFNHGNIWSSTTSTGQLIMSRVAAATGPSMIDPASNQPVCLRVAGDLSTKINGCVPMNVLGGQGAISPDAKNYVAFTGIDKTTNTLDMATASLSGEMFKILSDRPVGLALGVEHRREALESLPDAVTAGLDSSGNNQLPTNGSFRVSEAYAELSIPIMNRVPFVEDLELSLAGRIFKYNLFSADKTYKVGARYSPFQDLTLRGTYSTAFRAPNVGELYSGAADSYPSVTDPCNGALSGKSETTRNKCLAQGVPASGSGDPATQLLEKWLSNSDLKPEKAKTLTVGIVAEPRWVPGLSLTLDYYKVKVDDAIQRWGAGVILSQCYEKGNQAMCDLVKRTDAGQVQWIDDPKGNLAKFATAGLDFSVRYSLPTAAAGRFGFGLDGNLLQYHRYTDSAGFVYSNKGNYDYGVLPALKANVAVNWQLDKLGAGAMLRYIGSIKECASGACSVDATDARKIGAYLPLSLYVAYDIKSSAGTTKIMGGVQNVLDIQPPYFANAAAANSDPYTYDYIGRYFYVRLSQSF